MAEKIETVVRMSPLDIPKIIRIHWNAVPKEPVHLIGEPSTVKSASVFQESRRIAEEADRKFFDWNRSTLEEKKEVMTDPSGHFIFADLRASETDIGELRLQDMRNDEGFITFKYNILFEALSKPSALGVLFFDEMNLAPNMIKAQFYKIINDRAVGDIPISDGVLCVSAGNESAHARGVTEDPVPLVLRRGNYFVRPLTAEEYTDYAASEGHNQFVLGYLGFAPQDAHSVKYDLPDGSGQPCARTWSKLSNVLNANPKLSPEDVQVVAGGLVGQAVGAKFSAFVRAARTVNLQEILDKPELIAKYEENGRDLSLVYAIISGIVEKFRSEKKVMEPAFKVALNLKRAELGTFLLRSMKASNPSKFMKPDVSPETMDKVVERYAKFIFAK